MSTPTNCDARIEVTHRGRLLAVEVHSFVDHEHGAVQREVVRHPGAVVVVPVRGDGHLILIRNARIAVDETLWELPAGTLEPGEDPTDAAGRELREETGYRAARVEPLASFFTSPGFLDERLHTFVAEELTFVGQELDAGETIEPVAVPIDEVLAMIDDGRIQDGKTIACVLLWHRHHAGGHAASEGGGAR